MTFVLAIDQGTSGTKALVVDEVGEVRAAAEATIRPVYGEAGLVEQGPEALLDSVLESGRRAVAQAGVPIAAVALANQGETVLAWDPDTGTPLTPAIVWQDRRAAGVCERLQEHADTVAERTGLVLDPYFSAPKLRWVREQLTRDGVVTTTDTWLIHHLTGAFVTDASTASRSLLLDLDRVAYDDELVELFELAGERLPQVVGCDQVVGQTAVFGAPAPVAGLIVDQQAALLAEACLEAGTAKCTFGTGAFLLAQTGARAIRSRAGLTSSVAWTLRGHTDYCLDGQVYTAASAVRWLQDLGVISEPAELDRAAAADNDGVLCVPALAGLAAPWWAAEATATVTGLRLGTGRGHLIRAVLEGIAAQVAGLLQVVNDELGAPVRRLRVDGGLTRSRVLMQATADLAQVPLEVYPSAQATALGAAACARLALDPGLSPADLVGTWTPAAVFEPTWPAARAEEFLARWNELVRTTTPGV